MNKIYLLLTLFIFASINLSAQTPEPTPTPGIDLKTVTTEPSAVQGIGIGSLNGKTVSGGVLNGKANSLVKPKFPAAARAVKASGAVSVQVLIDEQGNVASASAISGHPLLRQASKQAALASKFLPTTLQGQPVKVSGIIIYNFVPEIIPKSFSEIGFELAILEKSKEVPNDISTFNISSNLPNDWSEEKELFTDFYKRTEIAPNTSDTSEKPLSSSNSGSSDLTTIGTGLLRTDISTRTDYSSERPKISAKIIGKIENRLSDNPNLLWKFRAGTILGRIAAQSEDVLVIRAEASNLNDLISNAPSEVSSTLESLRKFVQLIQINDSTPERTAEIKSMATKLRNF